ncbi:enoyl-CoA hydratase/isomerase family protein [Patulibacter minatonensis]|uniref:enoyl-CoA hydratase/isomerase family protein n=1 Tax=Patulibacter minatonensis TaxID=298163 RepID=UPI000478C9B4|nr:enoyl-CoA hydratase/isomerase family protein [Patulibacter minatonensis]
MTYETLRLDVQDGIAHVTLTQAERGNPIDGAFCHEINELGLDLTELSAKGDVRAVLLDAEGKAFSYGGDVKVFAQSGDQLPNLILRWTSDLHMGISRLQKMDAPIVAAVHGVCAGGMAAFVASCDYVVGSEEAMFVAAYTGIGYSCDASSSISFSRRMGLSRARRYLLLNERLDAATALDAGMIDEVVPGDELAARAGKMAARLAAGPTRAYGEIRRLLLSAEDTPLDAQLELEAHALARMAATEDAREGLAAIAERRKPNFNAR